MKYVLWPALLALVTSACAHEAGDTKEAATANTYVPLGKPIALAINGFNYTDLTISSFSINYQGGGNIYVSSPTSGGGGTVCCMTWRAGTKLPLRVRVEWMRFLNDRERWCVKEAILTGPVPAHPTAFGVHFMPDGGIQVEITEGYPKLKLVLQNFDDGHRKQTGNVIHDEEVAKCRDEY